MAEIKKVVSRTPVRVDELTSGQFQKAGTLTAMLRQEVTVVSEYPSAQHENNMQDNVFSADEFNDEVQTFTSTEKRVAFIDVPDSMDVDKVTERIPADAALYRVLSNRPILTDAHQNAISRGVTSLDEIADSQIVRYGDNDPKAGQVILDNAGKVQYRKVFFSKTAKADMDLRGQEAYPEYMTQAVADELSISTAPVTETVELADQKVM